MAFTRPRPLGLLSMSLKILLGYQVLLLFDFMETLCQKNTFYLIMKQHGMQLNARVHQLCYSDGCLAVGEETTETIFIAPGRNRTHDLCNLVLLHTKCRASTVGLTV